MIPELDELARSLTEAGPFAFCGIGVSRPGVTTFHTATAQGLVANEDSLFRVASISKIVTAAAFEAAASGAGLSRPYAVNAADVLGLDLRHPKVPDRPVTLGMLMTHTAGLSDAGGYTFDGQIAENWDPHRAFGPYAPGEYFSYSNLGYILLAAAAEVLSGERFEMLAQDEVLTPHGIPGGFNWAGVDAEARSRALPTFRRDARTFRPMIDAVCPDPLVAGDDYVLGQTTAEASPQGGLRTSLRGMLTLAKAGAGVERAPLWRKDDGPGDYEDGLFHDYGAGEQILPQPPFYPRPLVGHFGNAYGFKGGVWWDAEADLCFAYAINGLPMDDESDALSVAERRIFDAIAALHAP